MTRIREVVYFITALVIFSVASFCQGKEAQQIAAEMLPSVGLLSAYDKNGELLQIGSGFVLADGLVATNIHVIERAVGATYRPTDAEADFPVEGIVGIDPARDLVILKIPGLTSKPLTLATGDTLAIGERVFAAGNPRGMTGTFSDGLVSAIRVIDDTTIIQISAPISPGSSGGPILNTEGQVIGVAVATVLDGQNLNLSIAARHLKALLDAPQPVQPFAVGDLVDQASAIDLIGAPVPSSIRVVGYVWDSENKGNAQLSLSIQNNSNSPILIWRVRLLVYGDDGELIHSESVDLRPSLHRDAVPMSRTGSGEGKKLLLGLAPNDLRKIRTIEQFPLVKKWLSPDYRITEYDLPSDSLLQRYSLESNSAKRYTYRVPGSLPALNAPDGTEFPRRPKGEIELRILDYDFITE